MSRSRILRILGVAFAAMPMAGRLPAQSAASATSTAAFSQAQQDEMVGIITRSYVRPVPADSVAMVVRSGRFALLDPYSRYLDSSALAQLHAITSGAIAGAGLRVNLDTLTSIFRVVGVYARSPAQRGGIRAGDILLAVDGQSLQGRSLDAFLGLVRGVVGTPVTVTIRRAGAADFTVTMARARIEVPTVRGIRRGAQGWEYLIDDRSRVGYIHIEHFAANTPFELDSAIDAARQAGAVGLVLDLRDNGGGLTRAALDVADRFLDSGTITTFVQRDGTEVFRAQPGVATTLPLVLLINQRTASASELVASALQDNHRATVIGGRSFGKGHEQNVFDLADGHSALRLSTGEFFGPSHRTIERHFPGSDSMVGGVWPDSGMAVSVTGDEFRRWEDGLFALDDLMGLPDGQGPAPVPDRVLERAVELLLARGRR